MAIIFLDNFNGPSGLLSAPHLPDVSQGGRPWVNDLFSPASLDGRGNALTGDATFTFSPTLAFPAEGFTFTAEMVYAALNDTVGVFIEYVPDGINNLFNMYLGLDFANSGLGVRRFTYDTETGTGQPPGDPFSPPFPFPNNPDNVQLLGVEPVALGEHQVKVIFTPTRQKYFLDGVLLYDRTVITPMPLMKKISIGVAGSSTIDFISLVENEPATAPPLPPATGELDVTASIESRIVLADTYLTTVLASGLLTSFVTVNAAAPDFLVPGTVWVVNADTGASSTYSDFPFNSFAKIAGKYYGVKSDGLYDLQGSDPPSGAEPIIGALDFGQQDFGDSRISRVTDVYVGVSVTGFLFLHITADRKTYVYKSTRANTELSVQRFVLGKGLKSDWLGFRLLNADDIDFELRTIEFRAVKLTRRI